MSALSRRHMLKGSAAGLVWPQMAAAATPRVLGWEDLIPPGVPYAQIIGEGFIDARRDIWLPEFDENATKLNADLVDAYIKLPGFMLPLELAAEGITSFIMVPYAGACIHVPPPPANQLVFVETAVPWPTQSYWDPVWVTGIISHQFQSTTLADIGYAMSAERIEAYEWD
ncbi:MAG: DUF3299 domain-containing protein [Pseudomonadota bacterium]